MIIGGSDMAQLNILIVEDNQRTITLLSKFLESLDHSVLVAENGETAYQKFVEDKPDLILTDLNMPVVDGITLIKQIRSFNKDVWVPILILSGYGEEADIIEGLEAGADDYLTKPINMSILRAKIVAIQRALILQKNSTEALRALESVNQSMHDEQLLAKQLADKILKNGDLGAKHFDYWLCPAEHLSGDLISAKEIGSKLYVLMADSTGHGLAAALPTLAMARIFNSMSERGFGIESIVREMNKETKEMLPSDRFVAAAVFIIDFRHKIIDCWNGGLPAARILNERGEVVHEFKSRHLALSILSDEMFDNTTEMYHWDEACQLVTYSDGVTDAEDPFGHQFGDKRFLNVLKNQSGGKRIDGIKKAVLSHINAEHGNDDIAVAIIDCVE